MRVFYRYKAQKLAFALDPVAFFLSHECPEKRLEILRSMAGDFVFDYFSYHPVHCIQKSERVKVRNVPEEQWPTSLKVNEIYLYCHDEDMCGIFDTDHIENVYCIPHPPVFCPPAITVYDR